MEKVDRRREKIYEYIVRRLGEGVAPTVREICSDLKILSTSTVHHDLHHFVDAGMLEMQEGRNRTIRLPGSAGARVPLLGTVTAGQPILATENIEKYLPVALAATSKQLFALRVKGDSMKKAAILDGDIVVVEKAPVAENGEIVVALLDDEATVKRFYKEKGSFRLQPENDDYEPLITDKVEIIGKVVSVMRFY